jgi:hypothetical protein
LFVVAAAEGNRGVRKGSVLMTQYNYTNISVIFFGFTRFPKWESPPP